MNPLDLYQLDQKSWSFLNIIGQTPLDFLINGLIFSSGPSGGIVIRRRDTSVNAWVIYSQSGNLIFFDSSSNTDKVQIASTTGQLYPTTDAGASQTASGLFAGTGAPNNTNGNNGDIYFRSDGGALTTIYQRRAGAWVGIV